MAAPVDNTATLKSLVSIANSKIEPKILTDRNYKVQSIKPLRSTTSPHNSVATVLIDLAADSPIAIVSSDRYSRRLVEFTRIDLADIAKFRAIPKNAKGQFIGTVTDVASAITLLDANIGTDELVLIKTANATVVKAADDSLGYIGAITFAGVAEEPEVEPPVVLTVLTINGPTTLEVNGEASFTVTPTPAGASVAGLVWSADNGVIDNTGAFIAPAEAGNVKITATVGSVTKELTLVITAAE